MNRIISGLVLFLVSLGSAQANIGVREAVAERNRILSDLRSLEIERPALNALDRMLAIATEDLRNAGYEQLADKIQIEWKGLKNLGDHAPLLSWLEATLQDIERTVPRQVLNGIPVIADLRTMNYALAVVIQPQADPATGNEWGWLEYRKHFIPFLQIIVYWGSFAACKAITAQYAPELGQFCGRASEILRSLSGRTVAAPLSDYVYFSFNPDGERPPSLL